MIFSTCQRYSSVVHAYTDTYFPKQLSSYKTALYRGHGAAREPVQESEAEQQGAELGNAEGNQCYLPSSSCQPK